MYATRMSCIVGMLGLTAVLGVIGDADAACFNQFSDETYPGSMCRFYGTAASDTFFGVTGGGTSLRNTSASTQGITCPLQQIGGFFPMTAHVGFSLAEISLSGTGYSPTACGVHAT